MSKQIIYFFVKTFSEPSHAEQFLDGLLYMNSLNYFVKLEESESAGRVDRHEGVSAWLQPNEIQLEINGIHIDREDLAGPVFLQMNRHLVKSIFCMHAGYIGGNTPSEFATTVEFEQAIKIPQKNISLGQYSAVITNVKEFLQRVTVAADKQNIAVRGQLVNYYDPTTFHGHFAEEDTPFSKQIQFAYQLEFRLVANRQDSDASPYTLDIGSLRDIAQMISIETLNANIKISSFASSPQN
jgi:hypothetical protein